MTEYDAFRAGYRAAVARLRLEAEAVHRDYLAEVSHTLAAHGALIADETPRARARLNHAADRQRTAMDASRALIEAAAIVEGHEAVSAHWLTERLPQFEACLGFEAAGGSVSW